MKVTFRYRYLFVAWRRKKRRNVGILKYYYVFYIIVSLIIKNAYERQANNHPYQKIANKSEFIVQLSIILQRLLRQELRTK